MYCILITPKAWTEKTLLGTPSVRKVSQFYSPKASFIALWQVYCFAVLFGYAEF